VLASCSKPPALCGGWKKLAGPEAGRQERLSAANHLEPAARLSCRIHKQHAAGPAGQLWASLGRELGSARSRHRFAHPSPPLPQRWRVPTPSSSRRAVASSRSSRSRRGASGVLTGDLIPPSASLSSSARMAPAVATCNGICRGVGGARQARIEASGSPLHRLTGPRQSRSGPAGCRCGRSG